MHDNAPRRVRPGAFVPAPPGASGRSVAGGAWSRPPRHAPVRTLARRVSAAAANAPAPVRRAARDGRNVLLAALGLIGVIIVLLAPCIAALIWRFG